MTVKELINELGKYDENLRVFLYSHGRDDDEDYEILGCYEGGIYDEDDNLVEKIIELYEY